MHSNPTFYSSADEPVVYLDLIKEKSSTDDCEAYAMMDVHDQPHNDDLHSTARMPSQYETADNSINDNEVHLDEGISKSEPIYKDPGHVTKNIYEWLEKRKILKLDTKIVR